MANRLITVDEVAERYGVTPYTVRRWACTGMIRGMKIGRHTLFTQEALDEYERMSVIPIPRGTETPLQAFHRAKRERAHRAR